MPSLTSEERSFFSLVQDATAANPFSEARKQLDLKITGRYDQVHSQRKVDEVIHEVGRRIDQLGYVRDGLSVRHDDDVAFLETRLRRR
mgnify:CR=1 FL=1